MQQILDTCDAFATSRQVSYNATNSFSLYFKTNQFKVTSPSFVMGKHVIPAIDKCKYLGIIVTEKLFDHYLKRQMRKYYANIL